MAANTATVDASTRWGGAYKPLDASYGKLMMWFFLLSDVFTFAGLLIAYGMIRYSFPAYPAEILTPENFVPSADYWPVPEMVFTAVPFLHGVHLPLVFVALMSFILIISSVTMVLAVEAGQRMDQKAVEKWMLWTILGGITFLGCQAWEWSHFIHGAGKGTVVNQLIDGKFVDQLFHGANLSYNEYGPQAFAQLFFFITGFHGFHVFSGIVLLIIIFYNVVIGTYERRGHYEMVEKVGLYWHFVDLVWVFVFTFFYLI
ncbi:cytochrome c oxidase subunit 3 [Aureibacter tunicatorum]|uniref:Cytochrome c oxidase subunit 3 n=1 Tax=Aureibacter tunicatorum TaxID=866807 RepID=A0AAE3XN33_9BACT|nr:cytochrome c oxidase subunit 3 [Aureibacter tunicatorum]MDR6238988.1 cytochrome c oxidase subunit 3 [Aureibacter tunicatorum]BDD05086.1 bb3-type cytochrome oxidase subunit IV [Aureibacter tunicatorum]